MNKRANFKSVVWKEEKYFVSQCLNVDVASYGKTRKKALDNLQEAVELYFEDEKNPKYSEIEHPDLVSFTLKYA